jgi:hypothetical protein
LAQVLQSDWSRRRDVEKERGFWEY